MVGYNSMMAVPEHHCHATAGLSVAALNIKIVFGWILADDLRSRVGMQRSSGRILKSLPLQYMSELVKRLMDVSRSCHDFEFSCYFYLYRHCFCPYLYPCPDYCHLALVVYVQKTFVSL